MIRTTVTFETTEEMQRLIAEMTAEPIHLTPEQVTERLNRGVSPAYTALADMYAAKIEAEFMEQVRQYFRESLKP